MPAKGVRIMAVGSLGRSEVPRTLEEAPAPRVLGMWDQTVLWGNLGISLLLPVTATFIFTPDAALPALSLAAALTAVLVGTVIGNLMLGLGAVPGADTGAPTMVLLRGMLGFRGSWVPTAFNVVQLVGWTTFEIVIIAESAAGLTSDRLRWVFVIVAGAIGTFMAIRPLGVVRGYLKKVAVWVVLASTAYLFVQVLRRPLPGWGDGSWRGFWKGTDIVIALSVSWIPLAADYSRHSRSRRAAFGGAFLGYGLGSGLYFALGIFAFATASLQARGGDVDVLQSLLAIPAGSVALFILAADEIDEVFANLYSTVVSIQNVAPAVDRRVVALAIGALSTLLGLWFHIAAYQKFLLLIGSVFVPLFGTFAADYFLLRRRRWDTSPGARPRWQMLVPWMAGFVTYQLINPAGTGVGGWARWWIARQHDLHFTSPAWASASLLSLAVSAALALAVGRVSRPPG